MIVRVSVWADYGGVAWFGRIFRDTNDLFGATPSFGSIEVILRSTIVERITPTRHIDSGSIVVASARYLSI
jgi:hypothetical protein